jgi:hypothetical protein
MRTGAEEAERTALVGAFQSVSDGRFSGSEARRFPGRSEGPRRHFRGIPGSFPRAVKKMKKMKKVD